MYASRKIRITPGVAPRHTALFLAAALAGCGAPEPVESASEALDTAPLQARPGSFALGNVAIGVTSAQSLQLVNGGTSDVDIDQVTVASSFPPDPCRPILLQPCIRPGQSVALGLECAPTAPGPIGGSLVVTYKSAGQPYSLTIAYSGTAYFNVDLDPARLYAGYVTQGGVRSGAIAITAANTINQPLRLPCDVAEYGVQADVRYLTGGATVYPQLQSRFYVLPNISITSTGYSGLAPFLVVASNLAPLAPLSTETAGQASLSAIDQGRDYEFQPSDLPANKTVRHALHVTLFSDATYVPETTDGQILDNNRSIYVRRVCP